MKNLTLILVLLIAVTSCTSINKLVERGDYQAALILATKKLQGKEKKKTKHVRALETAFFKINERDMRNVKRLMASGDEAAWQEIFEIYADIDDRQEALYPLIPLVSKDGYKANFSFIRVEKLLAESADKAAEYVYNRGKTLLVKGKNGDKDAARDAYNYFRSTGNYFTNYRDSEELADEASYYGKTRVLVDVENQASVIVPYAFEREVLDIHVRDLNSQWVEYYVEDAGNHPIDVKAILEIRNIEISPEREVIHNYVDTKEIKDGFNYVLDDNGNVMKDTSGNDIKVDKFTTISAEVTEIVRTKAAFVRGNVYYYDTKTGERFRTRPVNVEALFEDIACQFRGDKRALKDKRLKYIKPYPLAFPSDLMITMDAAQNLKEFFRSQIEQSIY